MNDLYDTKPDLFVAGMAAGVHRVAVFSLLRYSPSIRFSSGPCSGPRMACTCRAAAIPTTAR